MNQFRILTFLLVFSLVGENLSTVCGSSFPNNQVAVTTNCFFAAEALALRAIQSPEVARELVAELRRLGILSTPSPLAEGIVAMAKGAPKEDELKRYLDEVVAAYPDDKEIQAHIEQVQRTWQSISYRVKPAALEDSFLRRIFANGMTVDHQKMPPFYAIDTLKRLASYLVSHYRTPIISVRGVSRPTDIEAEFRKGLSTFDASPNLRAWPFPLSILEKEPELIRGRLGLVMYWNPREGPSMVMGELEMQGGSLVIKPKPAQGSKAYLVPVTLCIQSNITTDNYLSISASQLGSVVLVRPPNRESLEELRQALESNDDLAAASVAEDLAVMARYDSGIKEEVEKIFEDFVFKGKAGQNLVLAVQETAPDWATVHAADADKLLEDPACMSRFLLITGALRKAYGYSENIKLGLASPVIYARRGGLVWKLGRLRLVMGSASFRRLIAYEEPSEKEVTYKPIGRRVQDLRAYLAAAVSGSVAQITWTDSFGQSHTERGRPQLQIDYPQNAPERDDLEALRAMYGLKKGPIEFPGDEAFAVLRLINPEGETVTIPTPQITELRYAESEIMAFQVKFPGEEADRDVVWDTHYFLAKGFNDDFSNDSSGSTMAEPLWMRTYLGRQTMFRRTMDFSPENPLTVVAFRYYEGLRLRHLLTDQFALSEYLGLQYVLTETRESVPDFEMSMLADMMTGPLTMVVRMHEKKHIGHNDESTDVHLENFMVPFPIYQVPPGVYNIADLGAMNEPEDLTPEMRRQEMAEFQAQYPLLTSPDVLEKAYHRMIAAKGGEADEAFKQRIRHELGLEKPAAAMAGIWRIPEQLLETIYSGFILRTAVAILESTLLKLGFSIDRFVSWHAKWIKDYHLGWIQGGVAHRVALESIRLFAETWKDASWFRHTWEHILRNNPSWSDLRERIRNEQVREISA